MAASHASPTISACYTPDRALCNVFLSAAVAAGSTEERPLARHPSPLPPPRSAAWISPGGVSHVSATPDPQGYSAPLSARSFRDVVASGKTLDFKFEKRQQPVRCDLKTAFTSPRQEASKSPRGLSLRRSSYSMPYRARPEREMARRRIHSTAAAEDFTPLEPGWQQVRVLHWWRRAVHSSPAQPPSSR